MFSRNKFFATLFVVPALVASTLIAISSPASAASGLEVRSNYVAVNGPNKYGHHKVFLYAKCHNKTRDCTGKARLTGQKSGEPTTRGWSYRIRRGTSGYITVYWYGSSPQPGTHDIGSAGHKTKIRVAEFTPSRRTFEKSVTLEPRVYSRKIEGKVTGPDLGSLEDVTITRWNIKGQVTNRAQTTDVKSDGTYAFTTNYRLGTNNASAGDYRLSIKAKVDGQTREWFWRGHASGNGRGYGGGKWIREAHRVTLNKYGNFQANFNYGKITGSVNGSGNANADIRVSAPPVTMPRTAADRRDLDITDCANDFAKTKADGSGNYSVNFLPTAGATDKRYMVKATPSSGSNMHLWNDKYISCIAARGYRAQANSNLLKVPVNGTATQTFDLRPAESTIPVNVAYSGFTPKTQDRYVTLREYSPGKKILDTPVIRETYANAAGAVYINGVAPGAYWVEVGRRTGCSSWYKSLYTNNYLYHNGLDRGNERWKTVAGAKAEYSKSIRMGFPKSGARVPSGYKGWMYRGFCETRGTGQYKLIVVPDGGRSATVTGTIRRGASISGHISRGSKSNKEMMVSVYSTQGVLVMRTAYSGRSGNFKVQGLAPGNYKIKVNADSWRGIGRSFSGTHTKRVSTGRSYSVGTLRAKF